MLYLERITDSMTNINIYLSFMLFITITKMNLKLNLYLMLQSKIQSVNMRFTFYFAETNGFPYHEVASCTGDGNFCIPSSCKLSVLLLKFKNLQIMNYFKSHLNKCYYKFICLITSCWQFFYNFTYKNYYYYFLYL